MTSKNTVVLTLAGHSEKLFAQFQSEKYFADGYANIFGHLSNSLISPLTVRLAFGRSLGGSPIISGWLLNPLISNRTANMQSGHNMRVSFSDAQTLQSSFSGVQKEKDSTANATLWDHASLRHEINQLVNYYDYFESVNQVKDIHSVNHRTYCRSVSYCSMPRDCNSLRIILFIHADTEASPSWANAAFIPCSRDGSTLNAICLFPFPDILMVDTWFTPVYIGLIHQVYDKCRPKTTTPRSATTLSRRLTKNVKESYAMDTPQHNQTRLKFTFLIASGTQRLVDIHPARLITVLADSEVEARLLAGMSSLIFVSRQAWDIGIDTPFNCSDMSTVQGVNHA
ncbi:hypothetical protein [Xenorhabdus ishibashii]|uniref:hypothetical protein n=2 Tax=Xenorhabdus ishibashii TaxID=1034471 RepID=UPI00142D2272|nr:hypothetical protein [Xenorhabdus ishibashii]